MANYYSNVSFSIEIPTDRIEVAQQVLDAIDQIASDNAITDPSILNAVQPVFDQYIDTNGQLKEGVDAHLFQHGCLFSFEEVNQLWVRHDESAFIESLAECLVLLLRAVHGPDHDKVVGFEWSNECSRPRLDAFGGGAVVITSKGWDARNTRTLLHEMIAAEQS